MKYLAFILLVFITVSCKNETKKESSTEHQAPIHEKAGNTQDQIPQEKLIIPGKQLALIQLNKDIQAVLDRLGKPDKSDAAMGKSLLTWNNLNNAELSIFTARKMGIEDFSRIKAIRSLSRKFKTKNNLGVGSTLEDIKQKFSLQKVGEFQENENKYTLYTTAKGISFEIDTDQSCHGVIITPKNDQPQSLYLPFYANFQKE